MYIIITKDILQNTLEDSSFLENVHKTKIVLKILHYTQVRNNKKNIHQKLTK